MSGRLKAPKKPPLTHFLCIPLTTPYSRPLLETALTSFKSDFLAARPSDVSSRSGDASVAWQRAVRPVRALHLTLGVMSLREKGRLDEALEALEELDVRKVLEEAKAAANSNGMRGGASKRENQAGADAPLESATTEDQAAALTVSLRSLHPMKSPGNTTTLYAGPHDATGRLMPVCEQLRSIFTEKGFLVDKQRPLKLHATIVNTIYAKLDRWSAGKLEKALAGRDGRVLEVGPSANDAKPQEAEHRDEQAEENNEGDGGGQEASEAEDGVEYKQQEPKEQQLRGKQKGRGKSRPVRFDAKALLEKYADFDWATNITLDRVAICEMGTKKVTDEAGNVVEEAYTEVAVKSLPT